MWLFVEKSHINPSLDGCAWTKDALVATFNCAATLCALLPSN